MESKETYGNTPWTVKQVHSRRLNWAKRCIYAMKGLCEWLHQSRSISYNTYTRLYVILDDCLDDISREEAALEIKGSVRK